MHVRGHLLWRPTFNRDEILPEAVKHWVSDAIDKYLETVEKLPGGRQTHLYCWESPAMISEAVSTRVWWVSGQTLLSVASCRY